MIDKYLLEDLSLRSDEKGELARWVIQLQADVDTERRKSASLESVIYARDTRIAELEAIRSDASQVFTEIGNELGCNPDNESIMMAIDELKATQMTGPLKDVLKRNIELEAKLATPVRLPGSFYPDGDIDCPLVVELYGAIEAIRAAGFTVEGDE
ncbi:hypothetical protein [Serratia sp. S119]|uniref:hypothetical protein n=1 Tax=Serratia sp. S119 TaxID=1118230 RepID=UPI00097C7790|nr:hypothetical protein [Serratia sp. S119]ONK18426.1 hypothetical protein BHT35_2743 [Serratia sp. S119]